MQFTVLKEGLDATTLKDCLDEMLEIQNDQEDYDYLELCWNVRWHDEEKKLASLLEWLKENNFIMEVDGKKKIDITKENYMEFCSQFYPFVCPMTEERRKRYEFLKERYAALLAVGCDYMKLFESRKERKQTEISAERLKAAIDCFRKAGYASTALLKRSLHIGFEKADPVMRWLEEKGYISNFNGSQRRKVLITDEQYKTFLQDCEDGRLNTEVTVQTDSGLWNKSIDIQKKKAALACIRKEEYVSISIIRNKLECSYQLAGQIVLWLENEGYIGTFDGAKHRKVLITDEQYEAFIKENFGENSEKN
mgnify:FL=1